MSAWARLAAAYALWLVLALVLHRTRGQYEHDRDVVWIAVAYLAFAALASAAPALRRPRPGAIVALLSVLYLGSAIWLCRDPRLLYASPGWAAELLSAALFVHAGLAVLVIFLAAALVLGRSWGAALWLAAGLAFFSLAIARAAVLSASPDPHIDVYTTVDRAVSFFLTGDDPYASAYPDIYDGAYDYRPGMVYPPLVLLAATIARQIFGDLRWAYLLSDLLGAVGLYAFARRSGAELAPRILLPLAWLAFPVSLFVLEQAWVDPLLFPWFAILAWALGAERWGWAGVALGALMGTKQYGVLAVIPVAAFFVARRSSIGALRTAAAAGLVAALTFAPFLARSPGAFFDVTVRLPLSYWPRSDALTLTALAMNRLLISVPGWVGAALLAGAGLVALARARGASALAAFTIASVLVYGAAFLGAKQAFCNYYQLLAYLAALCFAPLAARRD